MSSWSGRDATQIKICLRNRRDTMKFNSVGKDRCCWGVGGLGTHRGITGASLFPHLFPQNAVLNEYYMPMRMTQARPVALQQRTHVRQTTPHPRDAHATGHSIRNLASTPHANTFRRWPIHLRTHAERLGGIMKVSGGIEN